MYCFVLIFAQTAPVCSAEIRLLDLDTGERIEIANSSVELVDHYITFTSQQLVDGRRYNTTVLASNIGGSSVSHTLISEFTDTVIAVMYTF